MDYQFSNLLGAPYRGGNLVIHGTELLSPVGNRVSQVPAPGMQTLASAVAAALFLSRFVYMLADRPGPVHQSDSALREPQAGGWLQP
jgi:hypothetical protein